MGFFNNVEEMFSRYNEIRQFVADVLVLKTQQAVASWKVLEFWLTIVFRN